MRFETGLDSENSGCESDLAEGGAYRCRVGLYFFRDCVLCKKTAYVTALQHSRSVCSDDGAKGSLYFLNAQIKLRG